MMHFIRELNMQYTNENEDGESTCGYSTFANMPDYKSFKFIDNPMLIKGLNTEKAAGLECYRSRHQYKVLKNAPGDKGFMACEDSGHGTEYPAISVGSDGINGRRKIHIKKNVVDSFMPEMVGFFQDSNSHFFKDISGDIEAHCGDRCLEENRAPDRCSVCSILHSDVECGSEQTKQIVEDFLSISGETKVVAEYDCRHNVTKQYRMVKMMSAEEEIYEFDGRDDIAVVHLAERINPKNHAVQEVPTTQIASLSSKLLQGTKEADNNCTSEASYESEGRYSISTITNTETSSQDADNEDNFGTKTTSASRANEGEPVNIEICQQDLADPHSPSNPSLFADDPLSNQVDFLDPLPFCSTFSFRSSRSNSSSSSFAFPRLQSKWIGTPVRMPRAEGRQLQRHQYWRKNLLCCKF